MTNSNKCSGLINVKFSIGHAGETKLTSGYSVFPLHYTPPIYIDEEVPEMATLYIQNMTDGVCGGDNLYTCIEAGTGAKLRVTTTAATKLYRSDKDQAREELHFLMDDNAYIDYQPKPLIPFANSNYSQKLSVNMGHSSTFIATEYIYPGRIHRNEIFDYTCLKLDMDINCNGNLLCSNTQHIEPELFKLSNRGVIGNYHYMASLFVVAPWLDCNKLYEQMWNVIEAIDDSLTAVGILPYNSGMFVKILSHTSISLHSAVDTLSEVNYRNLFGTNLLRA